MVVTWRSWEFGPLLNARLFPDRSASISTACGTGSLSELNPLKELTDFLRSMGLFPKLQDHLVVLTLIKSQRNHTSNENLMGLSM